MKRCHRIETINTGHHDNHSPPHSEDCNRDSRRPAHHGRLQRSAPDDARPPCGLARPTGGGEISHRDGSCHCTRHPGEAFARSIRNLRLSDYLEPTTSYLSIIELSLYESTVKVYKALVERGIEPHSDEWKREIADTLARQKEAMRPRLYPEIPPHRYACFYPMDRRRGEDQNWYTLPIEERARQMGEHGLVGRRYAGDVKQIITGSIGFDDWEWGVDLFAEDPLVFKKLIYEMRFDHVSAVYALFGSFYVGLRCPANRLYELLEGKLPQHS